MDSLFALTWASRVAAVEVTALVDSPSTLGAAAGVVNVTASLGSEGSLKNRLNAVRHTAYSVFGCNPVTGAETASLAAPTDSAGESGATPPPAQASSLEGA